MTKELNIGKLNIIFVFKHKWEKEQQRIYSEFNTKQLGLFWRKDMVVGRRKKGKAMFDSDNLVPSYMFGINLIVCKFWLNLDINSLNIKI
ncbi:MAG: hypothetical protein ACK5EG_06935 [Chitinophagaceae bacterium]|jgi:hypothetical protein